MYRTLKIDTPAANAALKRPLLTPVHTISNQFAAIALRAWWESNTENDLAHHGLRVWRDHIRTQNADIDASSIPVLLLGEAREGEREILVAIFSDSSALALRSEKILSGPSTDQDCFQVLPIVLNLSSSFRPTDDRPDFTLKVKRNRKSGSLPFIAVGSGNDDDGWDSLESGHFGSEAGATWELRNTIKSDIISCARAWVDEIDALPVLHMPEPGFGYKSEAILDTMLGADLGVDPQTPYACPAFLPYSAYTKDEAKAYYEFCRDLSEWMLLHCPDEFNAIHLIVLSARMAQTSQPSTPKVSVKITSGQGGDPDAEWSNHLSNILLQAMKTSRAPIPYDRLVGQSVNRTPQRLNSSFVVEDTVSFVHLSRKDLDLSNHKRLDLERRFGRFPKMFVKSKVPESSL